MKRPYLPRSARVLLVVSLAASAGACGGRDGEGARGPEGLETSGGEQPLPSSSTDATSTRSGSPAASTAASGGDGASAEAVDPEQLFGSSERQSSASLPPRRPISGDAKERYDQGIAAARSGDERAASAAFEAAIAADANAYPAFYALGVMAERDGKEARALELYRRALRVQPDYERAAEGVVAIYIRRGQPLQALAFIEPLARQYEGNLALLALHAEVLVHAGKLDEAWDVARSALRRDERFVPAMVAIVKASLEQGRGELADSVLEQALKIDRSQAELHYLRGLRFREEERGQEALAAFRRAVELAPDYVPARVALGVELLQGANYQEAASHLQAAAELSPALAAVHLDAGDAYRALGRWEQAKSSFDKALEIDPQLAPAHFNMALMYLAAGGDFPGLDLLSALRRAKEEFQAYRKLMGPNLKRSDPTEAYLQDLDRQIEREQRRLEREEARRKRDAERAAREE